MPFFSIAIALFLSTATLHAQEWRVLALRIDFPFEETDEFTTTGRGYFDLRSAEEARAEYALPYDLPPHDRTYFEHHLEALRRYYDVVSEGRVDISYSVFPRENEAAYTMPERMLHYGNGRSSEEIGQRWIELLQDALAQAQADPQGPDLSAYNSFLIFHAGVGHETGALNDIRSVFLEEKDLALYAGGPLRVGDALIEQAWILPESPSTAGRGGLNGLLAKFFGHQLGLPGLSNFADGLPALGGWSLMDVGANALGFVRRDSLDAVVGFVPPHPMAWSKMQLGWIEPIEVLRDTVVSILATDRMGTLPKAVRIPIDDEEYFLLEHRRRRARQGAPEGMEVVGADAEEIAWIDEEQINLSGQGEGVWLGVDEYDAFVPGSGLLIWHVDERTIAERPAGAMNNDPVMPGIALEEADGYRDIGHPVFERLRQIEGSPDDPFRADGPRLFGRETQPNTRSNDGWATGIEIEVLSEQGDQIEVAIRFSRQAAGWPQAVEDGNRLQAADVDGDGVVELIVEDALGVRYAEWTGGLSPWQVAEARFLAAGDADGDGRTELFVQRGMMVEAWHVGEAAPLWQREVLGDVEDALWGRFRREGGQDEPTLAVIVSGDALEIDALDGALRTIIEPADGVFLSLYGNGTGFSGVGDQALQEYGEEPLPALWAQQGNRPHLLLAGRAGRVWLGDDTVALDDSLRAPPALGDVDGDGLLESVFAGVRAIHVLDENGLSAANFPAALPIYAQAGPVEHEPVLADIDGRGDQEIIWAGSHGIYAMNGVGQLAQSFPLLMADPPVYSPVVADLNADGRLDLAALSQSRLYVWPLEAIASDYVGGGVDWGQADGGAGGMRFAYAADPVYETAGSLLPSDQVYCYPNPVRTGERAHVRFFLREEAAVEVQVFDALGASVGRIVHAGSAGENEIVWDVDEYASGIYLCKIKAKGASRSASALLKMAVSR